MELDEELALADKRDREAHPPAPRNVKSSVYTIRNVGPARRIIFDGIIVDAANPAATGMKQIEIEAGATVEARLADQLVENLSQNAAETLRFSAPGKVRKVGDAPKFSPAGG